MRLHRPIRIIRRDQQERPDSVPNAARSKEGPSPEARPSERELQTVVAGWISEHRRRSEELQQNYSSMFSRAGFLMPRAASRA